MSTINTGVNYRFIATNFAKAKTQLNQEIESGVVNPDRVKGVGLEGASRTGKTFDACVFICQYIDKYTGKTVVIGRDVLAILKDTTYMTLKKVWKLFGYSMKVFNQSATDISYNGNTIKFIGINDNVERTEGFESDLLYINEALSVRKEGIDGLEQRCSEFFIYDYNPKRKKHFLYKRDNPSRKNYLVLKTVLFDNPYAPLNEAEKILSYAHPDSDDYEFLKDKPEFKKRFKSKQEWEDFKNRNFALSDANKFRWDVYGLGKRSASENLVFPELYRYEDEPSNYDWKLYGGDFGYKTDPAVLVQVIKAGKNLYIKEMFGETGLLNPDIYKKMVEHGCLDEISCWDSAEDKSVDELVALGAPAYAPPKAFKVWGIAKLSQFKIHIHIDSEVCYEEFSENVYLKKKDGEFKRNTHGHKIPEDGADHRIDAARYAMTYYYLDEAKDNSNND